MDIQEIMDMICKALGYEYVSDLRQEEHHEEILEYLSNTEICYKDQDTYKRLMRYILE